MQDRALEAGVGSYLGIDVQRVAVARQPIQGRLLRRGLKCESQLGFTGGGRAGRGAALAAEATRAGDPDGVGGVEEGRADDDLEQRGRALVPDSRYVRLHLHPAGAWQRFVRVQLLTDVQRPERIV